MAEPPQEENDDNPGSCIEIEEDPEHERVKCKLRSPKTPQRPNIKIQPHLSSRYPPGTLPANQRIWAATVARKEDKETSKIALGRPEYLSIVQKYAPGISQAQVNKLFWIIYEHGASDKASSKEDIMCYTAGDKSTHEICVIDSTINSVFSSVLKEVKGIDPEDKKDFARVMCNLIYGRCYNQIQRDMRTGRNKPQAKASSLSVMATPKPKPKPTPRKASTETHNRRVSKRLRQKLNYEGPAMPLTPVKTPTRGPFIPDTVEVHGVELEVRRNEVMVPEVGQFEAKEVDTDVMPLADIKRKTAEIELRNAIKVGKLMDLKLEVEMEKLKATK